MNFSYLKRLFASQFFNQRERKWQRRNVFRGIHFTIRNLIKISLLCSCEWLEWLRRSLRKMWSIVFVNLSPPNMKTSKNIKKRKTDCLSPREKFPTALCSFVTALLDLESLSASKLLVSPINTVVECPQSERVRGFKKQQSSESRWCVRHWWDASLSCPWKFIFHHVAHRSHDWSCFSLSRHSSTQGWGRSDLPEGGKQPCGNGKLCWVSH